LNSFGVMVIARHRDGRYCFLAIGGESKPTLVPVAPDDAEPAESTLELASFFHVLRAIEQAKLIRFTIYSGRFVRLTGRAFGWELNLHVPNPPTRYDSRGSPAGHAALHCFPHVLFGC
jgi:hypothetical protein